MIQDNIKIKTSKGVYKDFPYKKELYLYGRCVYTDDFVTNIDNATLVNEFVKHLLETVDTDKIETEEEI